ncbi:ATP-binding cassette domain-containing protein [Rhodococcus hoagii]|nr:ATP-binding cassette domain-containing protein [Prescottella equi]
MDEKWVVLGPNGAGKTSLLRMAAAEIHPTSGVGAPVSARRSAASTSPNCDPPIGLSSSALAHRVPADEIVSAWWCRRAIRCSVAAGTLRGHGHERAVEMLESLGAEHLSNRVYGTLSEGERKRVLTPGH